MFDSNHSPINIQLFDTFIFSIERQEHVVYKIFLVLKWVALEDAEPEKPIIP